MSFYIPSGINETWKVSFLIVPSLLNIVVSLLLDFKISSQHCPLMSALSS